MPIIYVHATSPNLSRLPVSMYHPLRDPMHSTHLRGSGPWLATAVDYTKAPQDDAMRTRIEKPAIPDSLDGILFNNLAALVFLARYGPFAMLPTASII